MRENKEDICRQLFEAIRRTRAGDDVVGLRYVKEGHGEHVYVDFIDNPGGRKINVSMDSGIAMIRDVVNNIDIGQEAPMQDYFEGILRTYHKQQGKGKGFQKELAQITHRSQGSISNYLKDPSSIRAGDLQAICRAWSINLEDTGRLIRCCEE